MGYTEQVLRIPANGNTIYGMLYLPENQEPLAAVILCHGIYASWQMTSASAKLLAEHGFAAYSFDFVGGSYSRLSGGETTDFSVITEIGDLNVVIDFFLNKDYVQPGKLFLYGESMGGVVASLTAAERPEDISGMILMYPAFSMKDVGKAMFPQGIPDVLENFMGIPGLNLGKRFFADIAVIDFMTDIQRYEKPVFITQGTDDRLVPPMYAQQAARAFPKAKLTMLEGMPHGYPLDAKLADDVSAFIESIAKR